MSRTEHIEQLSVGDEIYEKPAANNNQIAPGSVVRDDVQMGRGNVFLSFVFVDNGASIGDDNFIDSHVSIGNSAHVGDQNRLSAFVCLEGNVGDETSRVASIGNNNYLGAFTRIGRGITLGNGCYIGSGVVLGISTRVKDCRVRSLTKGDYISGDVVYQNLSSVAIARNSDQRLFNGVDVLPGEYVLFDNSPECMDRFKGDGTSNNGH